MTKTKHRASASQRREEVRSQRQQRMSSGSSNQSQSRNNRRGRSKRNNLPWGLIVGVLLVLAAVIGVFIYISQQPSRSSSSSGGQTPAPSSVLDAVSNVNPSVFAAVGTGGLPNSMVPTKKTVPPLVGPSGKPEFFYAGAEYCPYCAAERWGVIVALSRFGKFTHLDETTSSPDDVYPSTPTFTFYRSAYSSQYVDFVALETQGQKQGQPLQTPTAEQQQLINTFDGPPYFSSAGGIPFIDIGNVQLSQGANYSPQVLAGHTQQEIAQELSNKDSEITKNIVGTANYLTAAICMTTQQQPASVCSAAPIPLVERLLGKRAFNTHNQATGLVYGPFDVVTRRQD